VTLRGGSSGPAAQVSCSLKRADPSPEVMAHPSESRRRLLPAVCLVLAVALAGGLLHEMGETPVGRAPFRSTAAAQLPTGGPAAVRPAGALGLRTGEVHRYRFTIHRRTTMTGLRPVEAAGRAIAVTPTVFESRYAGRLVVRVYERRAAQCTVGFEAEQVEGADMGGEVLAVIERTGRVGKLVFPPRMTPAATRYWHDLLACWQVEFDDDGGADAWEVDESDPTGTCRVRYERHTPRDALPVDLTKSKLRYTDVRRSGNLAEGTEVSVRGTVHLVLDPLPRSIDGHEVLVIEAPRANRRIESECTFRLVRESQGRHTSLGPASLPDGARLGDPVPEEVMDLENVRSIAEAQLQLLEERIAQGAHLSLEVQGALARLVVLMQHSPIAADAIRTRLNGAACTLPAVAALTMCLGAAGTPAAQEVLREMLVDGRRPDAHRRQALIAVTQIVAPEPALDAVLVELLEARGRFSRPALLALGSVGGRVRESDPARHERIRERLLTSLRANPDPDALVHGLRAIENLRPLQAPAAVEDLLGHADRRVRNAAQRVLEEIARACGS